ncbi:MAG: diacylglycerol/lipid kinase family protein, partial [Kaistella sp.]
MENVAFIINPFSAKKNYHPFLQALKMRIPNPLFYISDSIEGTFNFIDENFATTDIFVAVGGDGTISTVAKKLIGTEKILAIFPAGSGNGFSNETKFSKDLDELLA